jgi:hypothetical protein
MARRYYVRHISHPRDNLFATRSLRSYKNFFRDGLHLNSSGVAAVACELAAFSAGVGGGERKGGTGTDLIFLYMTEVDRFRGTNMHSAAFPVSLPLISLHRCSISAQQNFNHELLDFM